MAAAPPDPAPRPVRFQLDKPQRRLVVIWSDGVTFSYPWDHLRANCPSAGEQVARQEERANPLAVMKQVPSAQIVESRMVGNYAISFTWADGHSAGIYTWEILRRLAEDPVVTRS